MIAYGKTRITITIPNQLLENLNEIKKDYPETTLSQLIGICTDWYIVNMFERNFKYTMKENEMNEK